MAGNPNNLLLLEDNHKLLTRLNRCTTLPSPPTVATRIIDLGQDPLTDMAMVAEVVSLDPALTAKIFRIANSAVYARQRKTENLRQALMLFGLNGTLTLALSFSLVSDLRARKEEGIDYNLFWRRSLTVAACCRELGSHFDIASREDLFLSGLLQDIGMLALDKVAPEIYQKIGPEQSDHTKIQAVELEALGSDHATVGAWLLNNWNLPDRFVCAVAASHDPLGVKIESEYQSLARCVAISSAIADIFWSEDPEQSSRTAMDMATKLLGLKREKLADVIEAVSSELDETAAMLDVDLGDTDLMQATLDQAKEILMLLNLRSIQHAAQIYKTTESLESRTRELEEEARRDGLTGLYNRASLDRIIQEEFLCAKKRAWPLSIIFIDLDHFKNVNDTYGHHAGDLVLRSTAKLLERNTRETDFVARYGGEEFVVILPGTDTKGTIIVCERLINAFRVAVHDIEGSQKVGITVSAGAAVLNKNAAFENIEALLQAADRALYTAKQKGRNRWIFYTP